MFIVTDREGARFPCAVYALTESFVAAEETARFLAKKDNEKGRYDRSFYVYEVSLQGDWYHIVQPRRFMIWDAGEDNE